MHLERPSDSTFEQEESRMRCHPRFFFVALVFEFATISHVVAAPLGNEDVINLLAAGLAEATVLQAIDSADPPMFDTTAAGMIKLKKAGASDAVIQRILARKSGNNRITEQKSDRIAEQKNVRVGEQKIARITEQNILSIEKALDDALMEGSAAHYVAHLANDFVYTQERPGQDGKSGVKLSRSAFDSIVAKVLAIATYRSITHNKREIVISQDGLQATVTGEIIAKFSKGEKDITSTTTTTNQYALRDGSIVLVSESEHEIQRQEEESPFYEADFAAYAGDGTATLEGEAFLRMQSGNIKNCAGAQVLLAPATRYDLAVMGAFLFSRLDTALKRAGPAAKYWRETQCDQQGKFLFENLPVGEWVVLTEATFEVVDQNRVLGNLTSGRGLAGGVAAINQASTVQQGGLMGRKVTVKANRNKVILTQENLKSESFSLFGPSGWPK